MICRFFLCVFVSVSHPQSVKYLSCLFQMVPRECGDKDTNFGTNYVMSEGD
jgi:hypothetical protein